MQTRLQEIIFRFALDSVCFDLIFVMQTRLLFHIEDILLPFLDFKPHMLVHWFCHVVVSEYGCTAELFFHIFELFCCIGVPEEGHVVVSEVSEYSGSVTVVIDVY